MKAMILAAGRGERMRPLTDQLPKPLLSVGGKPLIVHHIEKLRAAGVTELVINYAWLGHKLVEFLEDGLAWGVQIAWSPEESGGLETAGGIKKALPLLGREPFLVVNGDIWLNADYSVFTEQRLNKDAMAHLWLVDNPPQHPQGDFKLHRQLVVDEPEMTFSGIGIYHPDAFHDVPDGPQKLAPFLRAWMGMGTVTGSHLVCDWRDIGTPERLADLDQTLQNRGEYAD